MFVAVHSFGLLTILSAPRDNHHPKHPQTAAIQWTGFIDEESERRPCSCRLVTILDWWCLMACNEIVDTDPDNYHSIFRIYRGMKTNWLCTDEQVRIKVSRVKSRYPAGQCSVSRLLVRDERDSIRVRCLVWQIAKMTRLWVRAYVE